MAKLRKTNQRLSKRYIMRCNDIHAAMIKKVNEIFEEQNVRVQLITGIGLARLSLAFAVKNPEKYMELLRETIDSSERLRGNVGEEQLDELQVYLQELHKIRDMDDLV